MLQRSNYRGKLFQNLIALIAIGLLFTTIAWKRPRFSVETQDNGYTNIPAPWVPRTADWRIPAPPISIIGDAGWVSCPWVNGSGTWADPYRLCNLTINADWSGSCISITSTTKLFWIVNCSLTGAGQGASDAEISLGGVENGLIMNNTCSSKSILENSMSAITLQNARNITVTNNTCLWGSYGIFLDTSDNNTLTGNNCTKNGYGIHLKDDSQNNTLTKNFCTGSLSYGFYLDTVRNNTLSENNCTGTNGDAIVLFSSPKNTLVGNNCSWNIRYGIVLSQSSDNVIASNNCTKNTLGIWLDAASNNNTLTNNTCSGNAYGIELSGSSNNNTITANNCTRNSVYGIYFESSSNNTFTGNNCTGNSNGGICLVSSSNITLAGNNCTMNTNYGIFLRSSVNNTLDGNICTNGAFYGIHLDTTSKYNTITKNNCTAYKRGINLEDSSNNTLVNNTCAGNTEYGIYLEDSSNNTMTNNTCRLNTQYGIHLLRSPRSKITNNTCTGNTLFGIYISQSANITVAGNNCSRNLFIGIGFSYSDNGTITGNNCTRNSNYGIRLDYSNNNTLVGNNCSRNAGGVYLTSGAADNDVSFNWLLKNTASAVPDDSGLYNNVHDNFITTLPSASFIASRMTIIIEQSIVFNSTLSGGVAPFAYQWDFNDASPNGNTVNVTHQFTSAGTRQVTLTVTDSEGDASVFQLFINVYPLLTVSFTASDVDITPGDSVTFSDTTTGGVTPYAHYEWSFGDGTANSTLQNPAHQFTQSGNYQVILTVTDADGNINCYQLSIVVAPAGGSNPPDFTALITAFLVVEYCAFGLMFVAFVYHEVWSPRKKRGRGTRP